jgi:hypothetical protein
MAALLHLSRTGSELLLALTVGGFFGAVLVNLVQMPNAVRRAVLGLGVVVALIFVFTRPYGEDRFGWAIIVGFALLAWSLGFLIAGVARAVRQR